SGDFTMTKKMLLLLFVLLSFNAYASDDAETAKIIAAATDYGEGWYAGDAARMERALHPELAKRIAKNGRVDSMTARELVEGTRSGGGKKTPKAKQLVVARVLDRFGNAASVRLEMGGWIDYMHLAKFDGEWQIVNVLWELKPR
ncbi:MAG TPA: nuclear transport factor 2 family protein, partial [Thermoanaerobaculia bacterium]|nr:nuclear transport factor 2 family protein [Thermoanaerobaculia bacterium]